METHDASDTPDTEGMDESQALARLREILFGADERALLRRIARLEGDLLVRLLRLAQQIRDRLEVVLVEVVVGQRERLARGEDLDLDHVVFVVGTELFATAVASHVEQGDVTLS